MDDLKKLSERILISTLILALPCMMIAFLVFSWPALFGVLIGTILVIVGFLAIVRFCKTIESKPNAKRQGSLNYVLRFCLYGCVMAFFAYWHVPVLAMLVGILCNKLAILLVSMKLGKEADNVPSE